MEYLYCENANYEDYSSGRVLYSGKGIPNFPVRLINEIFGRAVHHLTKQTDLVVYDPCCGGGYSLTILGFFHSAKISKIYGSDISPDMLEYADKNLSLLQSEGLEKRKRELTDMYELYHKESHRDALDSIEVMRKQLVKPVPFETFNADCTKPLPQINPDIIITDIPYGNLVNWSDDSMTSLNFMLENLSKISDKELILALSMDKKQKFDAPSWDVLEKHDIGKRRFVIMKKKLL